MSNFKKVINLLLLSTVVIINTASANSFKTDNGFNSNTAYKAWSIISKIEKQNNIPSGLLHSMSLVETGQNIEGRIMPWPYTIHVNRTTKHNFTNAKDAIVKIDSMRKKGFKRFNIWVAKGKKNNITNKSAIKYIKASAGNEETAIKIQGHGYAKRFTSKASAIIHTRNLLRAGYKNIDVGLLQVNWKYHGENFKSLAEAFDPYHNTDYAVRYLRKHKKTKNWWESVGRYHSGTPLHAKKYIRHVYAMYRRVHNIISEA